MQLRAQIGFVLWVIFAAATTEGQNTAQPLQPHNRQPKSTVGVKPPAGVSQQTLTTPTETPQSASSLLDQPAKPAQVHLDATGLSVKADNSALTEILHNISAQTGMTVDGLPRDQRIFGSYGPAPPREVLSALLVGLGYNVMMVGALDNGAPRELMLSPRSTGGTSGNHQAPPIQQNNTTNDDEDDSSQDQQDIQPPRPEPIPPEANQPPEQPVPPANPGEQPVKTPQQMLQELQQMRYQQMQQQQQQPNPQ